MWRQMFRILWTVYRTDASVAEELKIPSRHQFHENTKVYRIYKEQMTTWRNR